MGFHNEPSKPELSTWLKTGTFYLAPTAITRQQRLQPIPVAAITVAFRRNGGPSGPVRDGFSRASGQQLADHASVDVGEPVVPALKLESQLRVIDTE
jgi:hypothetical protein